MATSQNWENIRPNTTIEKTKFYSLWSNKVLPWIVLHSSRPKALGVDNYKLFDFCCISLGDQTWECYMIHFLVLFP
jgi:hypothetical protein